MKINFIDTFIVLGYLVALLLIGFYLSFKVRNPNDFMLAGKSLPGWALAFSICATYLSNLSFVGLAGKAFAGNWSILMLFIPAPIIIYFVGKYVIPFYRSTGHISCFSHFEERFGSWAALYGSICFVLFGIFRIGTIIYLMSLVLSSIISIDIYWLIIFIGTITVVYTYAGGLESVVWTDVIQAIIMMVAPIFVLYHVFTHMPEGVGQVFEIANQHNKFSLGSLSFDFSQKGLWVTAILGITMFAQDLTINQNCVQRYLAAKSNKDASSSLWTSIWMMMGINSAILLIGTSLFAFYTVHPELSELEGAFTMKADNIFPHFIVTHLPTGLKGLLITAILASAMSSIDSALNSLSTVYTTNIYHRYMNRHPGSGKTMTALHLSSVVAGAIAILLGLMMNHLTSIIDVWFTASTILGGGTLGLFLLGFFFKKSNKRGAIYGTVFSTLLTAWMVLSPKLAWLPKYLVNPFDGFMTAIGGALSLLIVGVIFSNKTKKKKSLEPEYSRA